MTYQINDRTTYLRVGNILSDQYANQLVDADEFRFTRKMAWLWGTYDAILQHVMVQSFREDAPAFRCVVQNHGTSLSMGYFKSGKVEVRGRGYTILQDFPQNGLRNDCQNNQSSKHNPAFIDK